MRDRQTGGQIAALLIAHFAGGQHNRMVEGILDFQNFKFSTDGGFKRFELRRHAEISETVTEIQRFFDFSRWRPPPSWICKFLTL